MGLIRKWKPGGENQIRAVSLSRSGTDLVVRWGLAAENGKKTRIYFKRSDNGAVTLLTQVALNAGVRNFTLAAQGLSSPCGDFHLGQVGSDDVESPLTPALFFAGIDFGIGHEGGCIDDPPPTPEPPKWADYYHVRDHLGTLRLVTDISGYVQEAHDYEPFGLELVPPGESPGTLTTRKFTGHERDASTGLDYMMARYYPASMTRFLSVDPGLDNQNEVPQSWNMFGYVRNNPENATDPDGKFFDTLVDVGFIAYDAYRIIKDNIVGGTTEGLKTNAAALVADVGCAFVPFAAGGGAAVRGGAKLVEAGSEVSRGAKILENAAKGAAGEKIVAAELKAEGKKFLEARSPQKPKREEELLITSLKMEVTWLRLR